MILTFIGHSSLPAVVGLAEKVRAVILREVAKDEKVTFYCGDYGDFDALCAGVCRSLKPELPGSEVVFVTPYLTGSYPEKIRYVLREKLYDDVVYPPLETVPPRLAILKRNEWMVSQADVVLAYVTRTFGGAYKVLSYAQKKRKRILYLTENPECSYTSP